MRLARFIDISPADDPCQFIIKACDHAARKGGVAHAQACHVGNVALFVQNGRKGDSSHLPAFGTFQ